MIKEAILKLAKKEDLAYETAQEVMDEIMSGKASPVQMASYLTALSLGGRDESSLHKAAPRYECA